MRKDVLLRCLANVAFLLPFTLQQVSARDWTANPAIVEVEGISDTYVVGDVHGDYTRLTKLLHGAGVTSNEPKHPENIKWNAGKSVVIFIGDLIDKGDDSLKVISLVQALSKAAGQQSGQVIALMGNHEAEFLADPKGVDTEFTSELKDAGLKAKDVGGCKGDLGLFLCSLPFAARVNDWFFAHAGNTAGKTMEVLEKDLRTGVDQSGFQTPLLVDKNSLLETKLSGDSSGDNWFFSSDGEEKLLTSFAEALGVKHLVQGHEPGDVEFTDGLHRNKGEMFQRYGLIFLADTGMTKSTDYSDGAILHIRRTDDRVLAEAVCGDGSKTELWNDALRQDFGRGPRCRN